MKENIFVIESWNETSIIEMKNGAKHTKAEIKKTYRGELQGQGALEYLLAYRSDGSADFVGLEYFEGEFNSQKGTFSMTHSGTFNQGKVVSTFKIVPHSGTENLSNLAGAGNYTTGEGREVKFSLNIE